MTHKELVEIGYKWVMTKCGFAFKELVTLGGFGEIPDVIGFNHQGTFLLEAKASRGDFLGDKKKIFRANPDFGMGDWRFYIAPQNLIKISELPEGWGLIEVNAKHRARIVHNPFGKGNIYSRWERNKKYEKSELCMLYSALRRLQLRGVLELIYEKNGG